MGMAAPCTRSPDSAVGSVGPRAMARRGLDLVPSSQRPSHPVETDASVSPLCQMSMDSKWL